MATTVFGLLAVVVLVIETGVGGTGGRLNDVIDHYDTLHYNLAEVRESHHRARRSMDGEVELKFHALDRHFHLRLRRSTSSFTKDFQIETSDGVRIHDTSYLYTGELEGQPFSHCHGAIMDGAFRGSIYDGTEQYFIEPAARYFKETTDFHSVIYTGKDVNIPENGHGPGGCSMTAEILAKMTKMQENIKEESSSSSFFKERQKRDATQNTCPLFIETDHTFYERYGSHEEVVAAVADAVEAVNFIYREIIFGSYTDIGFIVKKLRIYTPSDVGTGGYLFSSENIGVEKFLDMASSRNFNDYCLAYTFCNRDFSNGVLGLAWIGYPVASRGGGICDLYREYTSQGWRSLNTGIVTTVNYGFEISPYMFHLTFAHELGHSLGSPHDYPLQCTPGGSDGNYIMYARSTSGGKINNNQFSSCSIGNMTNVLNVKKDSCFTTRDIAICGNGIIEEGEECDCGFEEQCLDDNCCVPQKSTYSDPMACTLVPGAQCSASQGICCDTATCQHKAEGTYCRSAGECHYQANCTGGSAVCPTSDSVTDDTICDNGKKMCQAGSCSESICALYNLEECMCTRDGEDCHLCCMNIGQPQTCVSASKWLNIYDNDGNAIYVHPGSPCSNFQGYCDVYNTCQDVDLDGPLISIINKIFKPVPGDDFIDTLSQWVQVNWWVILVCVLGLIVLMLLTVIICTRLVPSDNPSKKKQTRRNPVSLRKKRYRQSQMPGHHPISSDQHPDRAEERATRM